MTNPNDSPPLRPLDFSKRFNIGLQTTYRLIDNGELAAIDITSIPNAKRRRYAIPQQAVEDWLRRRTIGTKTQPVPSRRRPDVPRHF